MALMIYTKTGCPHCEAAMRDFREKGREFTEVNLSKFPDRIAEIKDLANVSRVPVIVDHGEVIIGFKGGS